MTTKMEQAREARRIAVERAVAAERARCAAAVREDRVLPETALVARVREEREAADALPNASLDNYAAAERAVSDARAATDAALAAAGGAS